jgi:hypothetical protein
MSIELMTAEDVARCLKISLRTVYENKNRLGGFYPAGLKVLRFRKDIIDGFMAGQETQGLAVRLPVPREDLCRRWTSYQSGGQKGQRDPKSGGHKKFSQTNPERHGL